ncbi:MerR family transcriptional regulator [Gordonia humi]|nr:HEAT repeat domain-containing protein [Gordonia humi]
MRIGEVARRSGVSARMLRHYDAVGLAAPSGRSSAGYREYSADDIVRIFHVESLRALGLSLKEVGQALDDPDFAPGEMVAELEVRTRARIAREEDLLARLRTVADAGADRWEQVLEVVALLSGLESGDASSRQRAALSAEAMSGERLARALLDEDDLNVAGALRWALARSGDDPTSVLITALADRDAQVRRRAVSVLVETPGERAVVALRSAVADGDPTVRSRAVLGLADRGDPDVVPALIDLVVDGVADVDAGEALGVIAADGAADMIVAAVVERLGSDAAVRRRIAQALGEIVGPAAASALNRLADDSDEGVAVTARYLIGRR